MADLQLWRASRVSRIFLAKRIDRVTEGYKVDDSVGRDG